MLNTILNPGNRVMSKKRQGTYGDGECCPLEDSHNKGISGRRIIQTKEQRPHRELCPLCRLGKGHMRWSSECG